MDGIKACDELRDRQENGPANGVGSDGYIATMRCRRGVSQLRYAVRGPRGLFSISAYPGMFPMAPFSKPFGFTEEWNACSCVCICSVSLASVFVP